MVGRFKISSRECLGNFGAKAVYLSLETTMKTLIKKNQFREMPWKNGLGVTQEIDITPANAELSKGDFHWRLSSAFVKTTNTFSQFIGYDRILIVLSGEGIKLNDTILTPLMIHSFSGEEKIECSLLGGEVIDLGIIYNRDLYRCNMKIMSICEGTKLHFENGIHYLKGISDGIAIDGITLSKEDVLKIEGLESIDAQLTNGTTQLLIISIDSK